MVIFELSFIVVKLARIFSDPYDPVSVCKSLKTFNLVPGLVLPIPIFPLELTDNPLIVWLVVGVPDVRAKILDTGDHSPMPEELVNEYEGAEAEPLGSNSWDPKVALPVILLVPTTCRLYAGDVNPIPTFPPEVTTNGLEDERFTWKAWEGEEVPTPRLPAMAKELVILAPGPPDEYPIIAFPLTYKEVGGASNPIPRLPAKYDCA